MRALDEKDGGSSAAGSSGSTFKVHVDTQESANTLRVIAALVGANLEVVVVDDETRTSKAFIKLNPADRYPLLEVKEGTLTGNYAISKYICKHSNKLTGSNNLENTKIDQWIGWN